MFFNLNLLSNKQLILFLYLLNSKKINFLSKNNKFLYFTNFNYKFYVQYNAIVNTSLLINNDYLFNFIQLNTNKNPTSNLTIQNNWLLAKYLNQLSYYYLGVNLNWILVDLKKSLKNNFFKKLWYIIYKKKLLRMLYGKKKKTISWFLQLYKLKDPQGLISLVQNKLYNTRLKRHKKIFFLLGFFFRILFLLKNKKDSLKGCTLFFKGKLGKKGSVRKSKFFIKIGNTSLTNKDLRINYKTYIIVTITGVVGCGISIFYK